MISQNITGPTGEIVKPEGEHWLVAAWPGMANLAVLSAGYLVQAFKLSPAGEIAARGRFDVESVQVRDGVVVPARMPKNLLYTGRMGPDGPRVTVFIGESQPQIGAYAFAHELIERAQQLGVTKVVTFASMASQMHPAGDPTVFAAATTPLLADTLKSHDLTMMAGGQIAGLNGVLLGAAAERGVPAMCLLGEIPFFASAIPNPKAAKFVLEAFGGLSDARIDVSGFEPHIERIEPALVRMFEQMQERADPRLIAPEFADDQDDSEDESVNEAQASSKKPSVPELNAQDAANIERLFVEARADRSRATALKAELDRLGVLDRYLDRFLDLFKTSKK